MKTKRIIKLALSSSLTLSSFTLLESLEIPLQAQAESTGFITSALDLLSVLNAQQEGSALLVNGMVQLQKDLTLTQSLLIDGLAKSSIGLDLNGKILTITTSAKAGILLNNTNSYSFILEDSGRDGLIVSSESNPDSAEPFALISAGSTLSSGQVEVIINSGTLLCDGIALSLSSNSRAEINGGSIKSTSESCPALNAAGNASIIMNEGSISSEAVVIKEDAIQSHNCAIRLNDSSSFTLKNGTIHSEKAHGIYLYGSSTLLVQGGSISGVCAIRTNGNLTNADARITIAAGTITGDESNAGLYLPSAQANITGGTISGGIGIFVRGQNNGLLSGNSYGGGLSVTGGTISGRALSGADPGTASIAPAFGNGAIVYDCNNMATPPYDAGSGLVSISGGTFISPQNTQAVKVLYIGQSLWNLPSSPLTISAGFFSSMVPCSCLAPGLCQLQNGPAALYDYLPIQSGINQFNASPGSIYTSYENLQKAQQASGGLYCTLTLKQNDQSVTYANVPSGSLINLPQLSLAGYIFTGYAPLGGALVANPYTITSDTVLIAQFAPGSPEPINPPTSGAGIDQPGSQSVPNTGGASTTTYTRDYSGVTSKIVTDNATGALTSLMASIPAVNNNSTHNPIAIPLGENTLSHTDITLEGNVSPASAPLLTITLPAGVAKAWISLPIANPLYSTVAMSEHSGIWKPMAQSIIDPDKGILLVPISNGQSFALCSNAKLFADQSAIPGYGLQAAAYLSSRDLMGVETNGNRFNPDALINRAQLAVILYRFEQEPSVSNLALPLDVLAEAYYSKAARWAAGNGLMAVQSRFNGTKALSREELVTILYRYQKAGSTNLSVLNSYADQNSISPWAREGMAWAVENRLVGVNSNLSPQMQASRINAATILVRYFETVIPEKS